MPGTTPTQSPKKFTPKGVRESSKPNDLNGTRIQWTYRPVGVPRGTGGEGYIVRPCLSPTTKSYDRNSYRQGLPVV